MPVVKCDTSTREVNFNMHIQTPCVCVVMQSCQCYVFGEISTFDGGG
jgi:hypothetical protein